MGKVIMQLQHHPIISLRKCILFCKDSLILHMKIFKILEIIVEFHSSPQRLDISINFIRGLPKTQGKDTIMVVIYILSKYAHFLVLGHPFIAKAVVDLFITKAIHLHTFPPSIIFYNDKIFLNHFWIKFFKQESTLLKYNSTFYLQIDEKN
ncbi:hypothetical protein CR513_04307, partial [Mucuna pruriens]